MTARRAVDRSRRSRTGSSGRGVLLDIPRLRGVTGSSPASTFRGGPRGAEREQRQVVREGGILLIRTGHPRRRAESGRGTRPRTRPGCIHGDGVRRPRGSLPSAGRQQRHRAEHDQGVDFPIHVLAIPRWGSTCSTTCRSRTCAEASERDGPLGVHVRRRAAPDRGGHRLASEPGGGAVMAGGYRVETDRGRGAARRACSTTTAPTCTGRGCRARGCSARRWCIAVRSCCGRAPAWAPTLASASSWGSRSCIRGPTASPA